MSSRSVSRASRALQRIGIRKWVNGAFTFTPDGNPLVGPVPGLRNYLDGVRLHVRILAGRCDRPGARQLDRRGRPGRGHLRHGRRALRCVREQRQVPARDDRAVLCAALRDRLSERGAAGGAAAQDDSELRRAEGCRRALRRGLGHGDAAVFRSRQAGLRRGTLAQALQCAPLRRSGSRRDTDGGGAARHRRLRPLRSVRTGIRRMARTACSPTACLPSASSGSRPCSRPPASSWGI